MGLDVKLKICIADKSKQFSMKDCVMAVQKQFEALESPEEADENSPYR